MKDGLDSRIGPAMIGIAVSVVGVAYALNAALNGVVDLRMTGTIRLILREGDAFFIPYLLFLGIGGLVIGALSLRDLVRRD